MNRVLHRVPRGALRRGAAANETSGHAETGSVPDTVDPHVARAIDAMKAGLKRRWTVAELARIGGLSRAAFARRFKEATGMAPLRWLTALRFERARELLVGTDLGLAGIAAEVGYESEFSFAKTFKRLFGVAPGAFRRQLRFSVRAAA